MEAVNPTITSLGRNKIFVRTPRRKQIKGKVRPPPLTRGLLRPAPMWGLLFAQCFHIMLLVAVEEKNLMHITN